MLALTPLLLTPVLMAADPPDGFSATSAEVGTTPGGDAIVEWTLENPGGMTVSVLNYGGVVRQVRVPDRDGTFENVTLSFENAARYAGENDPYFGATVGRYANRIAGGRFELDGKTHTLATNNGPNHLHGGKTGFADRIWDAEPVSKQDAVGVKLSLTSRDGEEGYPGELKATVTYSLTGGNALRIDYTATTTAATPVNLTNHNYWNLGGANSGTVLDQVVKLNASKYLPVDDTLIPTGELKPVKGTPFDFTKPRAIGELMDEVRPGGGPAGYDHNFVIDGEPGELRRAAVVTDPDSGRRMTILTTEPGLQFYTGIGLKEKNEGYPQYAGFCMEAQVFPDSPNQEFADDSILRPGETYTQTTVHRFGVAE